MNYHISRLASRLVFILPPSVCVSWKPKISSSYVLSVIGHLVDAESDLDMSRADYMVMTILTPCTWLADLNLA